MWPFRNATPAFKRFLSSFIKKDQIYIFFTLRGVYYIGFLITLGFMSMTFSNSLAYSSTFIFFSFLMISSVKTNYNLYKVSIDKIKQRGFFTEEDPSLEVLISNKSKKSKFDLYTNYDQNKSRFFSLKPYSNIIIKIPINKPPGIYPLNRLTLRTTFPFELMHSWKVFLFKEIKVIIFPKKINHLPHLLPLEEEDSDYKGLDRSQKGNGEDFHSHYPYSQGDSFRSIDWKIYAREKGTFIKTYEVKRKSSFCIQDIHLQELDRRNFSKREKDEQVTFWLTLALKEGREFSLKLNGLHLVKGKNQKNLEDFLFQYLKWRGL